MTATSEIVLKQPNRWTCLPTALAQLLKVPLADVIRIIGHDGSQIVADELEGEARRRCFTQQEIVYAALHLGVTLTTFEEKDVDSRGVVIHYPQWTVAYEHFDGILMGSYMNRSTGHAVCKKGLYLYDPSYGVAEDRYGMGFATLHDRVFLARVHGLDLTPWNTVRKSELGRSG